MTTPALLWRCGFAVKMNDFSGLRGISQAARSAVPHARIAWGGLLLPTEKVPGEAGRIRAGTQAAEN
jgi:hypothetical protein